MKHVRKKANHGHACVGIMDSDVDTVKKLTAALRKERYRVKSVNKTDELFTCINNNDLDILILDVDAWGVKGYELIPVIKRMDRVLPIIVTSADDSIDIAAKVREQGVFFYTLKPLDIAEIKLAMKNALEQNFTHRPGRGYRGNTWSAGNGSDEVLDLCGASRALHLSESALRRIARRGEIPGTKIGNKWIFSRPQLQQWLRLTASGNQKNLGTLILENMDEGVAVIDRHLKVISCNSAYLRFHGIPFDGIIGEQCYKVSRRSTVPCEVSLCPVRQSFTTKKPVKHPHITYDKHGNERYCDIIALPLEGKDGSVSEVIEIVRDNTDMYNTNKHLNWIMSFFANECKGTLGPVMMNISALADDDLASSISPVKQRNMLLSSVCSLKLLHDMIRNYIISYKAENKQLLLRTKCCGLFEDIVEPVLQEFSPVLLRKSMRIEVVKDDTSRIWCEPDLMKIALGNLINNATKYGKRSTTIVTEVRSNKKQVRLSVFNEGIGIAPNRLDDVFERFTRFDKLDRSGTGLGLHVVKMIMALHRGTARAESGYIIQGQSVPYGDVLVDDQSWSDKGKKFSKFARFVLTIPQGVSSREV